MSHWIARLRAQTGSRTVTDTDFSKRERRLLRELAGRAYEVELAELTEELAASFDEWRAGEIGVFDLNDRVHDYHDGAARELWKMYNYLPETSLVARGIAFGIVAEEGVPETVRERLESAIAYYRDDARTKGAGGESV